MENNKFLVPLSIVIAGGLIAGAIYFGSTSSPQAARNNDNKIEIAEITGKDHIRGNPNAEIIIVEYSDTECPFCKVFHNTMKQIMSEYQGEVAWVYRHFPIPQLHQRASKEAEATECAAELGGNAAFWSYIDEVFERTNSNDTLDPAELPKIAVAVGLNESAFTACLSSGRHTEAIKDSMEEAAKAGARGTPYSVILGQDGKVKATINGAEPLASVKTKLDALLK